MEDEKILIRNASQVVTCSGFEAKKGKAMSDVGIIEDGAVAMSDGIITHVGPTEEVLRQVDVGDYLEVDASGRALLPGFVDSHTHFVFGGYREEEFSWRMKGDSYMSIMERGGGIVNTMNATRNASYDDLYGDAYDRLDAMMDMGVTTVEGKSGYGLDLATELIQLRVMKELNDEHPLDVVSTFLGAHAVPPEFAGRTDAYVDYIIEGVLPHVRAEHSVTFCDVFCEQGVFSVEQSERLLKAARSQRFKLKLHADEIVSFGGAELAARLKAVSADHLLHIGSIPLLFALACIQMKLTPEEALTALTINGAAALGREKKVGSIDVGKKADLVLLKFPSYKFLPYHIGMNIVDTVIKDGVLYIV